MSENFMKFVTELEDKFKNLEARIALIESSLNLKPIPHLNEEEPKDRSVDTVTADSDNLEFNIGQYWFAKVGIVVLAIGVIFLLTLPFNNLPQLFPSMIGYFIMFFIFFIAHISKKEYLYISRYLFGGGLILMYFSTLRLHYFSAEPAITNLTFEVFLLTSVVIAHLLIALMRKSIYLTGIGITLSFVSILVSDSAFFIFITLTVLSCYTVLLKVKFHWDNLFVYGILSTYLIHFIWFINNPLLGNRIQLLNSPQANLYFILLYILIFSLGNLLDSKEKRETNFSRNTGFIISLGGYGLFLVISILRFQMQLVQIHLLASILLLILAVVFWINFTSKYSTFFYAIIGYSALSVAIIAQFSLPNFFVWLCWQSLLVIITSIWFRSKVIIIANFFIYLIIFLAYMILAGKISAFTLSYGAVALISARVLNWKKETLGLKTELIRNSYLAVAFFIFPYSFYKILPHGYVAISWLAISLIYYLLSVGLKNNKYRWMALLTLIITVIYIIIGTTKLSPEFRIILFLLLGVIFLIVSVIYARKRALLTDRNAASNIE
ncbi:MAG: hypothetical protein A2V66_03025 [Ignavibacteria bacterium RBG_13_36_8]|nr:MAG: hypothetical protein A2V66_03025 [Ignavibacteria bacterium RBG_13_36_8]